MREGEGGMGGAGWMDGKMGRWDCCGERGGGGDGGMRSRGVFTDICDVAGCTVPYESWER